MESGGTGTNCCSVSLFVISGCDMRAIVTRRFPLLRGGIVPSAASQSPHTIPTNTDTWTITVVAKAIEVALMEKPSLVAFGCITLLTLDWELQDRQPFFVNKQRLVFDFALER